MKHVIETAITINAPSSRVWEVLTDLASYPQWNPFILRASGKIALGEQLICQPQLPGGRQYTFKPKITRCVPGKEFAWTGTVVHAAIIAGEHIFEIKEIGHHQVKLIHNEIFTGLLGPIVMHFGEKQTTQGFILMNEALKTTAEACAAALLTCPPSERPL